jgi:hypothetical protein
VPPETTVVGAFEDGSVSCKWGEAGATEGVKAAHITAAARQTRLDTCFEHARERKVEEGVAALGRCGAAVRPEVSSGALQATVGKRGQDSCSVTALAGAWGQRRFVRVKVSAEDVVDYLQYVYELLPSGKLSLYYRGAPYVAAWCGRADGLPVVADGASLQMRHDWPAMPVLVRGYLCGNEP